MPATLLEPYISIRFFLLLQVLDVRTSIPMVMGANIGTSLTSTLVSLTQISDRRQFELAFAGATVHDCFNWLTVTVMMTLEITTGELKREMAIQNMEIRHLLFSGYLFHLTQWLTSSTVPSHSSSAPPLASGKAPNLLGMITKPLTKSIVQIDKAVLKCWGLGKCQKQRLLKVYCSPNDTNFADSQVTFSRSTPQVHKMLTSTIFSLRKGRDARSYSTQLCSPAWAIWLLASSYSFCHCSSCRVAWCFWSKYYRLSSKV